MNRGRAVRTDITLRRAAIEALARHLCDRHHDDWSRASDHWFRTALDYLATFYRADAGRLITIHIADEVRP